MTDLVRYGFALFVGFLFSTVSYINAEVPDLGPSIILWVIASLVLWGGYEVFKRIK